MMRPALGGSGRAALASLGAAPSLLAFDFDGTLAPIVARRGDARVPLPVARRLKRLCQSSTVAVFSGRSEDDVLDRLGFEPGFVVGNHGIPRALDPQARAWVDALDPARRALARHAAVLDAAGVQVEDKQRSIALHYRLATDRSHALQLLQGALPTQDPSIVVTNSQCTLNVAAAGAPDKCDALASLAHDARAQAVLFIGDESNDATLFAKAPADWVTVRIEPNPARSSARFYLDGLTQLTTLLQALLDARAGASNNAARSSA